MKVVQGENICKEKIFHHLFITHSKGLRNFLIAKFGDPSEAEDLVQDAFIKLWDNCGKVEFSKAKSYVFTVAVNLGISLRRHDQVKFKHHGIIAGYSKGYTNETPEFEMESQEFMETFKKSIASLPDRQREVFLLSRIEKKTYREIAELSGVSVKAIEKLMGKALKKMKEQLGNNI